MTSRGIIEVAWHSLEFTAAVAHVIIITIHSKAMLTLQCIFHNGVVHTLN